jgi:ribosome-binding ATPase YchF (GTP1/OBG family)
MLTFAILGKTNVGKTTLFNAASLLNAEISNYPFTTKTPNVGRAYVCDICVCQELGVKDNPKNSACIEGWRYIPVRIIDVPGLIKNAWKGRGLGNRFLSAIGQADAIIHVVDASGSIDDEGNITKPGSGNPVQDFIDTQLEIELWVSSIIERNRQQIIRDLEKSSIEESLTRALTGIKTRTSDVSKALHISGLINEEFIRWTPEDIMGFSSTLLTVSKPTLLIANKMDLPASEDNLEALSDYFSEGLVAACSAEAELALRRADRTGLIRYSPGQENFSVVDEALLTPEQTIFYQMSI